MKKSVQYFGLLFVSLFLVIGNVIADTVWLPTSSLNTERATPYVFAQNSVLYAIGGDITGADYEYSTISANGSLNPWTLVTGPNYVGYDGAGIVSVNSTIYFIGGRLFDVNAYDYFGDAHRATITPSGPITSFVTESSSLNTPRAHFTTVYCNGYMYAIGGLICDFEISICLVGYTNTVEYSQVSSDGSLGPWNYTTNMSSNAGLMAGGWSSGSTIYAMGNLGTIEKADQNPDGSLGPWTVLSNTVPDPGPLVITQDSYIYVVGNGGHNYKAVFNPTQKTIGTWAADTRAVVVPRFNHSVGAVWPRLYVVGGQQSSDSSYTQSVEYTGDVYVLTPVAGFYGFPTSGVAPLSVNFTDTSINSPTHWNWNFGDGGTATTQNPNHLYAAVSSFTSYTVSLIVSNDYNVTTAVAPNYITLQVPTPPLAGFYGTPTSGVSPLLVNFTDTSGNTPTSWHWDFGDGASSVQENPSHQYGLVTTPTTYSVRLIATNIYGSSTVTLTNYIHASVPPPAVAGFFGSPTTGTGPLQVNFTDTSANSPTNWSWDFGDGQNSNSQNPVHTYAAVTVPTAYTVRLIATNSFGSGTITVNNYIYVTIPGASAGFFGSPTSGFGPLQVNFVDTSANNPTSRNWDFGDGNTSITQNPAHTYAAVTVPTAYTVRLIVSNTFGTSTATAINYIHVSEASPVAGFSGAPTSGNGPLLVNFVDTSANNPTNRNWDFGDGNTSITQNPAHTYAAVTVPTAYTVRLIVSNSFGMSTASAINYISLSEPPPTAGFFGSPTFGTGPFNVNFMDTSGNNPTSWHWDFGDGSTSNVQSPVHTYGAVSAPTCYTVTLVVSNAFGTSTSVQSSYVCVFNLPPSAGFVGTPTFGTGPFVVNFTDTSAFSPTSWHWTFGDGSSSNIQNPSHTYGSVTVPTCFNVTLIATNAFGSSTVTQNNYICDYNLPPSAGFIGEPTSGNGPLTVNFTDTSAFTPTNWHWTFGDGSSSNLQNPSHTYAAVSTPTCYTVTLIVGNAFGVSTDIQNNYICVANLPPSAGFYGTPTVGDGPLNVVFTDTSDFSPTSWNWTFGDGSSSNLQNPSHTYAEVTIPTSYTVRLIATNPFGASTSTRINYITVTQPSPNVGFFGTPTSGTGPLQVNFTDTSANVPSSWAWDFGDGSTSSIQDPTHVYNTVSAPTSYTVQLIATNAFGVNTVTKVNYISVTEPPPSAGFYATPTIGVGIFSVNFTDTSANTPTSWAWNFGDGNTSNVQDPSHSYQNVSVSTTYTVQLIASNTFGISSISQTSYIYVLDSADGQNPILANIPSLKLFINQSLNNAINLEDYNSGGKGNSYSIPVDFLGLGALSGSTVNQSSYSAATSGSNLYQINGLLSSSSSGNKAKYSTYKINKLPKVGLTSGSSWDVNVASYTSNISGPAIPASFGNSGTLIVSDTTKITATWVGNTIVRITSLQAFTGAVSVDVIASTVTASPFSDLDKERIWVYSNILSSGTFVTAADTVVWSPLESAPGRPNIASSNWLSNYTDSAGTQASGVWHFTFANSSSGVKSTPKLSDWTPMLNGQWYTIRMRLVADQSNSHQSFLFAYNNYIGAGYQTDVAANAWFGIPTIWSWQETPLLVHGTSTAGYPQFELKAGGSGNVYVDEVQIINAAPTLVDSGRYKTRLDYPYGDFNTPSDTTGWGEQVYFGAGSAPGITVSNNQLVLNFSGASSGSAQVGIKWTANNGLSNQGAATYSVTPNRQVGVRATLGRQSGTFNSLGIFLVAAFGVQTSGQQDIGTPTSNLLASAGVGILVDGTYRAIADAVSPFYQMQFGVRSDLPGILTVSTVDLDTDQDDPNYGDPTLFP